MQTTLEVNDERSPKRQAVARANDSHSAACAVAEMDDAIWTSIVEFLPVPKDLQPKDRKNYDTRVSEVTATWQTLLNLRLVSPKLAELLHPREQTLWGRLVLQSFDFTSEGRFNTENHRDDNDLEDPEDNGEDDEEDDGDDEEEADGEKDDDEKDENSDKEEDRGDEVEATASPKDETKESTDEAHQAEQDPQRVAMRGRYEDMPEEYLEEDLVAWSKLGIFHRPSQYGFLTTLQQQPAPQEPWPESENAFTLYGDIVRLLQLPHGDGMGAGGEAGDETDKVLAAPTEAGPSSPFYRFYVMKTLGYAPHFWHLGSGISEEWKGFSEQEAMEEAIVEQLVGEDGEDQSKFSFQGDEGEFEFPDCNVGDARRLFEDLCDHARDWRSVCCNEGSDGFTPVFFVGESKAAPHRWTGYVGLKCWT